MIRIGITMAGIARTVAATASLVAVRGTGRAPARGARNQVIPIIAMPATTPGMAPPRNRAPIETPVTEP